MLRPYVTEKWYTLAMQSTLAQAKIDKTTLVVTSLDENDELAYWLTKTPQERLQALEQMRQIIYGYDPSTRLQRVLTITEHQ